MIDVKIIPSSLIGETGMLFRHPWSVSHTCRIRQLIVVIFFWAILLKVMLIGLLRSLKAIGLRAEAVVLIPPPFSRVDLEDELEALGW